MYYILSEPLTIFWHQHQIASNDPVVRCNAVRALGYKPWLATAVIIEALEGEDDQVRAEAALSLGRFAPEPLRVNHAHGDGARLAVAALSKRMSDLNPLVRRNTAQSLGKLAEMAQEAIPQLVEHVLDSDCDTKHSVIWALYQILLYGHGRGAVIADRTSFIKALDADNPRTRVYAVLLIVELDDKSTGTRSALLRLLDDNYGPVRCQTLLALQKLGILDDEVVAKLCSLIGSETEGYVWNEVCDVLAKIGPRAAPAVSSLRKYLTHPGYVERQRAARTLGTIGPSALEAVPDLRMAIGDKDPRVRSAARDALNKIEVARPRK